MTPPNENWQVGDLALCFRDKWGRLCGNPPSTCPRAGGVYRVSELDKNEHGLFLILEEFGWGEAWDAADFKRIRPLTDEEQRQAREEMGVPEVVL